LGGNRRGELGTYTNLLATFIIGGMWHGAGWTFLFWGFLHGIALVIHRAWSKLGYKLWTWLAWFITFNFVNIAWIFFRAKEWNDAIKILKAMFNIEKNLILMVNYVEMISILLGFIIILLFKNSMNYLNNRFSFTLKQMLLFIIFMFISILMIRLRNSNEFLYFNF